MKVLLFEEHSSAFPAWWSLGVKPRTIVYLDAHLDLQPIGEDRIARLAQCRSTEELRALEKPHPLCPDREGAYSLEDWLYPAHRIGLVERLVWVVPPHVGSGFSSPALAQLQQMDGVTVDDLESFRRVDGGWIEGRLLGINLSICSHEQLVRMPLPAECQIDIDVDYFVEVPADRPWIDPREVFETLRALPLRPPLVTISRSVASGFTPLRHRFIGDWLAALWEDRMSDSEHFERLFRLDQRACNGGDAMLEGDCLREARAHPTSAAAYLLSLVTPDRRLAEDARRAAEALSDAYAPDVLREACEGRNRHQGVKRSSVLDLERRLERSGSDARAHGLGWAALCLLHAAFGDEQAAREAYARCAGHFGEHPESAASLARLLVQHGHIDEACTLLESALHDDKTHTSAQVSLAQIALRRGELESARSHLQVAIRRAPAWTELLRMLAGVEQRFGHDALAQDVAQRSDTLDRRLAQIAPRLL